MKTKKIVHWGMFINFAVNTTTSSQVVVSSKASYVVWTVMANSGRNNKIFDFRKSFIFLLGWGFFIVPCGKNDVILEYLVQLLYFFYNLIKFILTYFGNIFQRQESLKTVLKSMHLKWTCKILPLHWLYIWWENSEKQFHS